MTPAASDLTPDEAAVRARQAVGASSAVKATVRRVTRLDRPGEAYYLVVLGDDHAAVGIAAIKSDNGDIIGSALLGGVGPHLCVDAPRALRIAKLDNVSAELVWQPCRASLSPLYPFWRITSTTGTVFVDQQGRCWDRLPSGRA